MNRLVVQLSLVFGLAMLLCTVAITFTIDWLAGMNFRSYLAQNQVIESGLLERLRDWYNDHGSWTGVEVVFPAHGGRGRGWVEAALVLADRNGQVILARQGMAQTTLTAYQIRQALPVIVDEQIVGYLLVQSTASHLPGAATQFLQRLRDTSWMVGGVVGSMGIIIGWFIAYNLTKPLRNLAQTVAHFTNGQLTARAVVEGPIEIRDVASAFNELAERLVAIETQRRHMIADIAHELRTPLTVIQGNLRAILDEVYPLSRAEIARVYETTLGLRRLVDDLQQLSLADAGQLTMYRYPLDLNELLQREAELFGELAAMKSVTLRLNLGSGLPEVLADGERIAQVVRNLLSNALRHTPTGGRITMTTTERDGGVQVSVTDTSSGIAAEDLPHIFERFYRADRGRSRAHGGSGLGLAIAERLVTLHGGKIGATSEVGQGSSFWFWLPGVNTGAEDRNNETGLS